MRETAEHHAQWPYEWMRHELWTNASRRSTVVGRVVPTAPATLNGHVVLANASQLIAPSLQGLHTLHWGEVLSDGAFEVWPPYTLYLILYTSHTSHRLAATPPPVFGVCVERGTLW